MRSGAPGSAGETFVAEENETQQRRTIVAVSERDSEPGWKTGEENEERRNVFVPKEREWNGPVCVLGISHLAAGASL